MKRVKGTEGNDDYVVIAENAGMWLAAKPFIVRMPITWSCAVGVRYRASSDSIIASPEVYEMAWPELAWQAINSERASASYPVIGINIAHPAKPEEVIAALGLDTMMKLVDHAAKQMDLRTRVHDFDPDTLAEEFASILHPQVAKLPPGQGVPPELQHLPDDQLMAVLHKSLSVFLEGGAIAANLPKPDTMPHTSKTIH